ncbi:MAG: PAS domain-containing sensor histidine kinase [Pseudomonadales bacterium]|nr:PAS domain-containing sensor histidine kinase [Pseudomonadales bacterium]
MSALQKSESERYHSEIESLDFDKRKSLEEAFLVFSDLSKQLSSSHELLEAEIRELKTELTEVDRLRLQELSEKECLANQLEETLSALPAGVVVLDNKGQVKQTNPASEELLGTPLLGRPLLGRLWREVITNSFAPKEDDGHEISLKDGRKVGVTTRCLKDGSGQIIVLNDLTETRQLQSRLSRHRRLSDMGRMTASLAHQIRTPLSTATLYGSFLVKPELAEDKREKFASKLMVQLAHIEQQIKELLLFSRGEVVISELISQEELLNSLEASLCAKILQTKSKFTIVQQTSNVLLECNKDALLGALINVVCNGIDAASPNADIKVIAKSDSGILSLSIIDNGCGIEQEKINKIFEPFYTTKGNGTGLGMAVVQAVVKAHSGNIEVHSGLRLGTEIKICIPCIEFKKNGEII